MTEFDTATELFPATLDEQIAEVNAEIIMRQQVYRKLVDAKRMSQKNAVRKIFLLEQVVQSLTELREIEFAKKR